MRVQSTIAFEVSRGDYLVRVYDCSNFIPRYRAAVYVAKTSGDGWAELASFTDHDVRVAAREATAWLADWAGNDYRVGTWRS